MYLEVVFIVSLCQGFAVLVLLLLIARILCRIEEKLTVEEPDEEFFTNPEADIRSPMRQAHR